MSDRPAKGLGPTEPATADVDAATRRLMAALDALESAVERRRDADRDENELASRIQALGTDRSRLADELDGALVKSRRLERTNREIASRLDTAIGSIRAVLNGEAAPAAEAAPNEDAASDEEAVLDEEAMLEGVLGEDDELDEEDEEED